MSREPRDSRGGIVVGAFIVAIGLGALLNNLGLFDLRLVRPFWPLVFAALGAIKVARARDSGSLLAGGTLIAVGTVLTLQNLGLVHFRIQEVWPVVLIVLGLNVILKSSRDLGRGSAGPRPVIDDRLEHGSVVDASATLSGIVLRNDSPDFRGGRVAAVMGSLEIDLRQAMIATEATLHLSVIMGGVEIRVPREWSVCVACTPILGGVEDKTVPPMQPGRRLVLDGSLIMGGVAITN